MCLRNQPWAYYGRSDWCSQAPLRHLGQLGERGLQNGEHWQGRVHSGGYITLVSSDRLAGNWIPSVSHILFSSIYYFFLIKDWHEIVDTSMGYNGDYCEVKVSNSIWKFMWERRNCDVYTAERCWDLCCMNRQGVLLYKVTEPQTVEDLWPCVAAKPVTRQSE